jgi:hypothetical protein
VQAKAPPPERHESEHADHPEIRQKPAETQHPEQHHPE